MTRRLPRIAKKHSPPTTTSTAFQKCSLEEQAQLLNDFASLRLDRMRSFLKAENLRKSGTKDKLVEELEQALLNGQTSLSTLVEFLDEEASWGKQHVYLLGPPL